ERNRSFHDGARDAQACAHRRLRQTCEPARRHGRRRSRRRLRHVRRARRRRPPARFRCGRRACGVVGGAVRNPLRRVCRLARGAGAARGGGRRFHRAWRLHLCRWTRGRRGDGGGGATAGGCGDGRMRIAHHAAAGILALALSGAVTAPASAQAPVELQPTTPSAAKPAAKPAPKPAPPKPAATQAAVPAPLPAAPRREADLAYGAYQRGYYITAFAAATRRADEQKDVKAMTLLGELYVNGLGVQRDDKKAAEWYRLAAERGDREAMFALAMLHFNGRTGAVD